jgi:hypothetical protein
MWPWTLTPSNRLCRRAEFLRAIDAKLAKEDIDRLPLSDLDRSIHARQLNDVSLNENQKRQLLKDWVTSVTGKLFSVPFFKKHLKLI